MPRLAACVWLRQNVKRVTRVISLQLYRNNGTSWNAQGATNRNTTNDWVEYARGDTVLALDVVFADSGHANPIANAAADTNRNPNTGTNSNADTDTDQHIWNYLVLLESKR